MKRAQANSLLMLAAFFWGTGNVMQQTVLANMGPFSAIGFRCLLALLVIMPFLKSRGTARCKVDRAGKEIGLFTVLFFALAIVSQQIGFGFTTVTNAGFIVNLTTVLTPIFAWLCVWQKPDVLIWPAAAASLGGAALMSTGSLLGFNVGDFLCFLSAIFFSLWMVFLGQFVSRYKNVAELTLLQFAVCGMFCMAFGLSYEIQTVSGFVSALPSLLYLGVLSTGAAFLLQSVAQQHTSSSEAAIIASGEAIFGAVGAILLLKEIPTFQVGIGAVLMCSGILIVQAPRDVLTRLRMPKPVPKQRRISDADHDAALRIPRL
jgi:drug/metabolite transporter (DMT)-like permease